MLTTALLTLPLALLGGRDTLDPSPRLPGDGDVHLVTVTDTVLPTADTYIRKTLPNTNWGSDTALQVGGGGWNRVLLRFDSVAIRQAVGTGTLDSAWVEFTITASPSGWGATGRTLDLHRLTRTWTELGATWNCAIDAEPANGSANCPTASWDMTGNGNGTYHPTKTDRVTVVGSQTGVIRLNVTGDVQGFLTGTLLNEGWMFRKTNEAEGGEAVVFSREGGSQPRLVLTTLSGDTTVPAVPLGWDAPGDTTLTVPIDPAREEVVYRGFAIVIFDSIAPGPAVHAVLSKYSATISGGYPEFNPLRAYVLAIPDPGPTLAALDSVLGRLEAEPGVLDAYRVYNRFLLNPRGS